MNNTDTVDIKIYGRTYPVKTADDKREALISANLIIDQQLHHYKTTYEQLDKQDCLSMALIENQLKLLESSCDPPDQLYQRLQKIDLLLESFLMK